MAPVIPKRDEFADYVELGYDGLGYIATVQATPVQAQAVTALMTAVSECDWAEVSYRVPSE